MLDKIADHEDQVILTKESYKSTNVSVNESTNIDNPIPSLFLQCLYKLQGLSIQYLHEVIITILYLNFLYENASTVLHLLSLVGISLRMSICGDILNHLYACISTNMLLLISLRTSLLDEFLRTSLLIPLGSGILQLSTLTSLQSNFDLISLQKIFL